MLKQLLLTTILISMGFPIIAQHHFPKDSAEWKVFYNKTEGPATYKALKSHAYSGDTVIMGHQYKEITVTSFDKASAGFRVAFLREVDTLQKVYLLFDNGSGMTEYLLYDFSKTIGDTISIPVMPYGTPDTIKWYVFNEGLITIDQQQRRFMDLEFIGQNPFQHSDSIYMDRWIEGIGSVRGLFAPFLDDGSIGIGESLRYHLVCFNDKGANIQYEPNLLNDSTFVESHLYIYYDSISDCNTSPWNNLSEEETVFQNDVITTFPNPFTAELHISSPAHAKGTYSLYNSNGKLVLQGKLNESGFTKLPTAHLPKGLYFLRTKTNNDLMTRRIIHE